MTAPIGPIASIASLGGTAGPVLSAGSVPLPSPGGDGGIDRDGGTVIGPSDPNRITAPSDGGAAGGDTPSGIDFASELGKGLDAVAASQHRADELAVQAATGRLDDPAQLTIATTQAQLMTQLATTIQSKAVTAFNTIMSMQA